MPNQPKKIEADIEQVEAGRFKMTGTLDFETVPVILQKSRELFSDCESLDIDFSAITRSNSAGLALLIEWMRNARASQQPIAFHHLPVQMQEIARLCGVEDAL
ncbi:STAS domain-containing protein [Kaarinaea lacus]